MTLANTHGSISSRRDLMFSRCFTIFNPLWNANLIQKSLLCKPTGVVNIDNWMFFSKNLDYTSCILPICAWTEWICWAQTSWYCWQRSCSLITSLHATTRKQALGPPKSTSAEMNRYLRVDGIYEWALGTDWYYQAVPKAFHRYQVITFTLVSGGTTNRYQ